MIDHNTLKDILNGDTNPQFVWGVPIPSRADREWAKQKAEEHGKEFIEWNGGDENGV